MSDLYIYLICDAEERLLSFKGIPMFDREVNLLAIFDNEADALEVLYNLEVRNLLPLPHKVVRVQPHFSATV